MNKKNSVFIATSLDGYIADSNGGIDWLESIPNPNNIDMGYNTFIARIDAIVMGRKTFETVCGFAVEWPYKKPVFVLSTTLNEIPEKCKNRVQLVKGTLKEILSTIHRQGHNRLYIDGGKTIQSFLQEDLIEEMILTTIPIVLGGGIPLFSSLSNKLKFKCIDTKIYLDSIVQNHYLRIR